MAKITFTNISLENIGPFKSRQTLDFSVTSAQSVILVKALNGSGKTTMLTALQIGLYGVKSAGAGRRAEYEQLITALQRNDTDGFAKVSIGIIVDTGGKSKEISICREWPKKNNSFAERFSVVSDGMEDFEFTQGWEDFIGTILPAELAQLFLFDGEKIEALANPDRLPDLLRRATEVFLGIGGIDTLNNDLKALERRSLLRNKGGSSDYDAAKTTLLELEEQLESLSQRRADTLQAQAATKNANDQAQKALDQYMLDAQREGLGAYEKAAQIRSSALLARQEVDKARAVLSQVIADPILCVQWLGNLWSRYTEEWAIEKRARHSEMLIEEFKKRDQRILSCLSKSRSDEQNATLKQLFNEDLETFGPLSNRIPALIPGVDPSDVDHDLSVAVSKLEAAVSSFIAAKTAAEKAEQILGAIPADEQLAEILKKMKVKSQAVAISEQRLLDISETLGEIQTRFTQIEARLSATRARLSADFKDEALEAKGLEAASRARKAMIVFKERLLAAKAVWLSDMITTEFKMLLRKRKLVSRVIVDPLTYKVTIEDGKGKELSMDRLSAGERQMLAVAVLSALIKERKGRFPVVVDTPLARLDRQHRTSLIKRFFATISHQVIILSTDEEVDGVSYDALRPHTKREYVLEYTDESNATTARIGTMPFGSLEAA